MDQPELRTRPPWLNDVFPLPSQSVVVNGRTMAYVEAGPTAGRPVLLLSGNPTWGFLYRDFFEPLASAGYRAIAPDWVGTGYSDHPRFDSALTFAHHISDLTAFIDQLGLDQFVIVGQDWGGPQGLGAGVQRRSRLAGFVLMSTWAFTGNVGRFHSSSRPWTTWHAPLIGQFFMKRLKVLSHGGPPVIGRRGMSETEARAYHHVFDEPDSDNVVLTWPRTIPMREGDRGWEDMSRLQASLPLLAEFPALLLWATNDSVFGKSYADRLKDLLPQAEGPFEIENSDHFIQDDKGPEVAARIVEFLDRRLGPSISSSARQHEGREVRSPSPDWRLELRESLDQDLADFRFDPLLVEQELDVRPEVARALETAAGTRSGRRFWRSAFGHCYALELADLGRGLPSAATVYGLWTRWEPRPAEHEIDQDLLDFILWVAAVSPGIEPEEVRQVAARAGVEQD